MPGRILTIDGFLDASGEADESVTVRVTRARLEMRVGDRRGDESVCDVSFEAMEHSADSSRRWVAAEPAPVAKRLVFETYVCDRAGRWNDSDSVNTLVPSPQSFPETPWAFLVANPCLFRGEADGETTDGHAPSPVMNVELTQPLGGPHQGLYRFPRVGERVLVADLGDRLVLAGYVPDRANSFGDFPAAGDVWTRQGELMRYRPPAGCERQPGETDEIGFSAYADAVEELAHRITDGSCVDFLIGVASAANHLQMLNAVRNGDAPRIESARARYLENPGKESVQAITVLAQELAAKYPMDGAARTILNLRASGTLVQRGDRGIDISTPGALNINAGEIFINGRRAVILQSDGKVQEAVGASSATVNPNGVALRSRRVIDAAGEFDSQVIVDAADGVTATGANVRLDGLFGAELSDAVGGSVRAANGALLVAGGTIDVATVTRPALVKAFGRVSQRSGLENVNETLEKWQEGRTPDGRPRSIADRGVGATGLVNRPMPQNGGGAGHFRGTAAGVVRTGGSAADLDLVAVSNAERTGGASDRYNGKDANLTVTKRELLRAETFARQVDTHRQAVESVIATSVDGKASSVTLRGHQLDVNVQVLSDLSATHLSDDCSTGGAYA